MSHDLQRLADLIHTMRQSLTGCQDGFCVIRGKAKGMHTNGGCRCIENIAVFALELAAEADKHANRVRGQQLPEPSPEYR